MKKKSRIFFDEKKFNIFFGILQIATLVKIFKKTHFFKKNDEKNQNFKNSNDRSMKHPMGWVRAKYQLQHSSDGFSKSTPVILPKTFNLLRKSQKSNVNQQKVYMPKKICRKSPDPKKSFWNRNYYSFDCVQIFRAIRAVIQNRRFLMQMPRYN